MQQQQQQQTLTLTLTGVPGGPITRGYRTTAVTAVSKLVWAGRCHLLAQLAQLLARWLRTSYCFCSFFHLASALFMFFVLGRWLRTTITGDHTW